MTTKVLTAHIPLPLAEKVDRMATRPERSRGWIIKQALSAWIDREEQRQRHCRRPLFRSLINHLWGLMPCNPS